MWDAHCHLDDPGWTEMLASDLQRNSQAGVLGYICAGFSPERWAVQSALAKIHSGVHLTYGLHPWVVAEKSRPQVTQMLEQLEDTFSSLELVSPVGVGEMGLDRSNRVLPESLALQEYAFREQLALARKQNVPVVLHVVRAHAHALTLLKQDGVPKAGGMVHGFSGSLEVAESYTQLGLSVSFGRAILRDHFKKARRSAAGLPSRWLLVETDGPTMTTDGQERDSSKPGTLSDIVAELATLRNEPFEAIAALTTHNTKQLFGL